MEQIVQKAHRLSKSVYKPIERMYSSGICCFRCCKICCNFGFDTCIEGPTIEEAQLDVCRGDTVLVSKQHRYWLYGKLAQVHEGAAKKHAAQLWQQGWFPRVCAANVPGVFHKVPQQKLLQGMWDTETRRVIRVAGVIVYVWSRNRQDPAPPFALKSVIGPDGKAQTVQLQGCTLLRCDGAVAHWSNGDIWLKQQSPADLDTSLLALGGEDSAADDSGSEDEVKRLDMDKLVEKIKKQQEIADSEGDSGSEDEVKRLAMDKLVEKIKKQQEAEAKEAKKTR